MKAVLELPTSVNALYRKNKWGSIYLTNEGRRYKENTSALLREIATKENWTQIKKGGYVYLNVVVYFNQHGRDVDNISKVLQDAITASEIIWEDDDCCLFRPERVYIDRQNPRVEIEILPTGWIGIFPNKSAMAAFLKDNCNNCSRGKKHGMKGQCGIFTDMIHNTIRSESTINTCSAFKEKKGG